MAGSDKIRIATSVPSKIYIGKRRVTKIYRADLKNQIFPFTPPLPVIDLVDPSSGLIAGGSTVVITGDYFSTVSAVKFGTTNASSFTINNSSMITATVPPSVAGDTTVTVTNATGVSNAYPFTYRNTPPAQRITKLNDQDISYLRYTKVTSWQIDPAYSTTVVVQDGIQLLAGKPVLIEAAQMRNGGSNGRARIVDSAGNILADQTSSTYPILIPAFSYTPSTDTVVSQIGYGTSGVNGNNIVPDGASTYIMVTPQ